MRKKLLYLLFVVVLLSSLILPVLPQFALATSPDDVVLTINVVGSGTFYPPSQSSYAVYTSVDIDATPSIGWVFSGWSGDLSSKDTHTAILMDTNKVLTVTFTPKQCAVTFAVDGRGTIMPSIGTYTYSYGDKVKISATPSTGYSFRAWFGSSIDNHNASNAILTVRGDAVITGYFIAGADITPVPTPTPEQTIAMVAQATIRPLPTNTQVHNIPKDTTSTAASSSNTAEGFTDSKKGVLVVCALCCVILVVIAWKSRRQRR